MGAAAPHWQAAPACSASRTASRHWADASLSTARPKRAPPCAPISRSPPRTAGIDAALPTVTGRRRDELPAIAAMAAGRRAHTLSSWSCVVSFSTTTGRPPRIPSRAGARGIRVVGHRFDACGGNPARCRSSSGRDAPRHRSPGGSGFEVARQLFDDPRSEPRQIILVSTAPVARSQGAADSPTS
jgi:hypothetical protein